MMSALFCPQLLHCAITTLASSCALHWINLQFTGHFSLSGSPHTSVYVISKCRITLRMTPPPSPFHTATMVVYVSQLVWVLMQIGWLCAFSQRSRRDWGGGPALAKLCPPPNYSSSNLTTVFPCCICYIKRSWLWHT